LGKNKYCEAPVLNSRDPLFGTDYYNEEVKRNELKK